MGRAPDQDFTLQIGRHEWHVYLSDLDERGYLDRASYEIGVRARLSAREKNITLFHELLDLLLPEAWGRDEEQVERLARRLYRVLARNGLYRDPFRAEP
jgi:hypothetical protein